MGGLIMEKNIIGEVKIHLLTREAFTIEKWKTGDYILVDYWGREVTLVNEQLHIHSPSLNGYYVEAGTGSVYGTRLLLKADNNSQRPYLERKKENSSIALLNSFKYIHFIAGNNSDVHHYYGAYLSNQETLAGSTFSLEIK